MTYFKTMTIYTQSDYCTRIVLICNKFWISGYGLTKIMIRLNNCSVANKQSRVLCAEQPTINTQTACVFNGVFWSAISWKYCTGLLSSEINKVGGMLCQHASNCCHRNSDNIRITRARSWGKARQLNFLYQICSEISLVFHNGIFGEKTTVIGLPDR